MKEFLKFFILLSSVTFSLQAMTDPEYEFLQQQDDFGECHSPKNIIADRGFHGTSTTRDRRDDTNNNHHSQENEEDRQRDPYRLDEWGEETKHDFGICGKPDVGEIEPAQKLEGFRYEPKTQFDLNSGLLNSDGNNGGGVDIFQERPPLGSGEQEEGVQ